MVGSSSAARAQALLLLGVVFHAIYAASIFDIYFRSPIVHGMLPLQPTYPPPAKRLVLFVGDGLRADRLFEIDPVTGRTRAPFVRKIAQNEGVWGVSHTRVPTESRPGHVALIAGLYEDENPVEFDSVFNESAHTWSFGSPDILPMFAKGASRDKVETFMYGAHAEDFAKDAKHMDAWVFEQVEALFAKAERNETLQTRLHEDKIVIFLHLLGLDTNGHAHLPNSNEYFDNIHFVDAGIERIVALVDEFFEDDATAFIFTADHGMNDRGAHGDGDPTNTRTPFVAWGAGIRKPVLVQNKQYLPQENFDWKLDQVMRTDIQQADVAPLMSALIGVPYPVNSVGVLPLDVLEDDALFLMHAYVLNAKQIYQQFLFKEDMRRRIEFFFTPFPYLNESVATELISYMDSTLHTGKGTDVFNKALDLISLSIQGCRYYETYDWVMLRSVVSAGYLGWIAFSITFMMKSYSLWGGGQTITSSPSSPLLLSPSSSSGAHSWVTARSHPLFVVIAVWAPTVGYLWVTSAPVQYMAYFFFPCYFWVAVLYDYRVWLPAVSMTIWNIRRLMWAVLGLVSYVIALEFLVLSYYRREVLGLIFVALALWPLFMPSYVRSTAPTVLAGWSASCIGAASFMMFPVVSEENLLQSTLGGMSLAILGILVKVISMRQQPQFASFASQLRGRFTLQLCLILMATLVVRDTSEKLSLKQGLPFFNQTIAWAVFVSSLVVPFWDRRSQMGFHFLDRLNILLMGFGTPLVILSISYEVLFYSSLSIVLLLWLHIERSIFAATHVEPLVESSDGVALYRKLTVKDARLAWFFLFFINVAYFGTGNVASIASFSVSSVYRLTTVFNPFLMGGLLLFKIMLPYFFVSAIFGLLTRSVSLPPSSLFVLVLSAVDVMTLNFFYNVRDQGSWLEIGTSISHFVIASAFIVFLTGLFYLSHLLVGTVAVSQLRERSNSTNKIDRNNKTMIVGFKTH